MSEWLGPDVTTIKCSRFDDIRNGIDSLAEFRETDTAASYLGLAIDVTTAQEFTKKFEKIKQEIERGKLGRVKYFASEHTNIRGEFSNVPKVVVGADRDTVKLLANLCIEKDKKALALHPVQFQILEEIILELGAFEKYARQKGKDDLASVYEKTGKLVQEILNNKRSDIEDTGQRDSAFFSIQDQLASFD